MNASWHPNSVFTEHSREESRDDLRWWTADMRTSSRLLICVFDDEFESVVNGESLPSTGSDTWWIRFAIETALNHQEVRGVVLSSFERSTILEFVKLKALFENCTICCLLDIYIAHTKESPGVDVGRFLLDNGISPDNIRPFSNRVSPELEQIGIRKRIRKPVNEGTEEEQEKFKNEINEAIDGWAAPFRTRFKSDAGVTELQAICDFLKVSFHQKHSQKCHEIADCEGNTEHCWSMLAEELIGNQSLLSDLVTSLTDAELLTDTQRQSLFAAFDDEGYCATTFALSKCLSRFGTEEKYRSVPGHWIELALGAPVDGLSNYQYPITNFRLQPIFGFLHAVAAVGKHERLRNASLADNKLTFDIGIEKEDGKPLETLRDRASGIFQRNTRPSGGEWTSVLQAFCDSGAVLLRNVISVDGSCLELSVELCVLRVG